MVTLKHISHPEKIFTKIQDSMRENGFHLQQDELVQEAKPHKFAICMEILSAWTGTLMFFAYFGTSLITS